VIAREDLQGGLRSLLGRLRTYRVDWRFSFVPAENVEYEPGIDRDEEADLERANVVSSERLGFPRDHIADPTAGSGFRSVPRHAVLLDIDYPAYLVESSSPGHYHLYLDPPLGVRHEDYMELLALLGRIGIIERGYAEVSIKRGHSDLRLPWVTKDQQVKHQEGPGVNLQDVSPVAAHGIPTEDLRF
jgi:hypothetical protein